MAQPDMGSGGRKPVPLAILVSDVHLSAKSPTARSGEKSWYAAMARPIGQLKSVARTYDIPVVCGGDLFHVPEPPPSLINFALDHLPTMYAVPGQHDLRNHVYADMDATAYGVMKRVGIVIDLEPGKPVAIEGAQLHGFPWGFDLTPAPKELPFLGIHVAVCHRYVWTAGTGHPDADPSKLLERTLAELVGFRSALFGDNHTTIKYDSESISLFNPGSFLRRRTDDAAHRPCVGILMSDGTIKRKFLDCSEDVFCATVRVERKAEVSDETASEFVEELKGLEVKGADYRETVVRAAERPEVSSGAADLMRRAVA